MYAVVHKVCNGKFVLVMQSATYAMASMSIFHACITPLEHSHHSGGKSKTFATRMFRATTQKFMLERFRSAGPGCLNIKKYMFQWQNWGM